MRKFRRANNYFGGIVPIGWHTPTFSEMYYILNSRSNASNLRTLGRIDVDGNGTYRNGLFLLPDDWVLPTGVTMTITVADFITNSYSLNDFEILENAGVVFLPLFCYRNGISVVNTISWGFFIRLSSVNSNGIGYCLSYASNVITFSTPDKSFGFSVRLCKKGFQFSVSATEKIDFAMGNIQYHCLQKIWRFAEHQYDIIGADNANIDDNYDGWIDLFGYGTSGVNYSSTLHTINNSDYANGNLLGTPNDWGVNF